MLKPSRSTICSICLILSLSILGGCGSGTKAPGGTGAAGNSNSAQSDGAIDFHTVSFLASPPNATTLLAGVQEIGTPECAVCHSIPGSPIQALRTQKSFDNAA